MHCDGDVRKVRMEKSRSGDEVWGSGDGSCGKEERAVKLRGEGGGGVYQWREEKNERRNGEMNVCVCASVLVTCVNVYNI